jgi:hypothetical protein
MITRFNNSLRLFRYLLILGGLHQRTSGTPYSIHNSACVDMNVIICMNNSMLSELLKIHIMDMYSVMCAQYGIPNSIISKCVI